MLASSSAESAEVAALEEEMATELAREVGNRGKGDAQGSPELDEGPSITPTPSRRADIDRYTFSTFTSQGDTQYQCCHTDQYRSCGMCHHLNLPFMSSASVDKACSVTTYSWSFMQATKILCLHLLVACVMHPPACLADSHIPVKAISAGTYHAHNANASMLLRRS